MLLEGSLSAYLSFLDTHPSDRSFYADSVKRTCVQEFDIAGSDVISQTTENTERCLHSDVFGGKLYAQQVLMTPKDDGNHIG